MVPAAPSGSPWPWFNPSLCRVCPWVPLPPLGSPGLRLAASPQWGSARAGVTLAPEHVPPLQSSLCSPRAQIQDVGGRGAVFQKASTGYIVWMWIISVMLLTRVGMYVSAQSVISAVTFALLVGPAQEYPWYLFYSATFLETTLNSNSIVQPVCIPPEPFITCTLTKCTSYSLS